MDFFKPLISIIIPVYNGSNYIDKIVDALTTQTYKNLDIIFINDGSTDGTMEKIINRLTDKRIRLINTSNNGAAAARNRGIVESYGEFIAFVDVDDYVYPNYISYLYELISSTGADISCCNYLKLNESEKIDIKDSEEIIIKYSNHDAMVDFLYRKHITGYPCLKLFKKSILSDITFPEGISYCEDFIVVMKAIKKSNYVSYGSRILYLYYQHNESATHNFDSYKAWQSWNLVKTEIDDICLDTTLRQAGNAKLFILSSDFCSRIWNDKNANLYKSEMLKEIKKKCCKKSSCKMCQSNTGFNQLYKPHSNDSMLQVLFIYKKNIMF